MVFRRFLGVTVVLCLQSGVALAAGAVLPSEAMVVGGPIKQPFGHHAFCLRQPEECGPTAKADKAPPLFALTTRPSRAE